MVGFDYRSIARQYGINDDKKAKKLYMEAMDITRKLSGDVPQNALEAQFPKELMDNYQDVLQTITDQNHRESVKKGNSMNRVQEMAYDFNSISQELRSGKNVGGYKIKDVGNTWILLKNGRNVGEARLFDNLVFDVMTGLGITESTNKNSMNSNMKNKTKIREYLESDMPLDELINKYDLEEEESYSQSIINRNTKDFKGKRKEYADKDGDLSGTNGYGASYAQDGSNAYGTTDDKQEIIDAETAIDSNDNEGVE
ncbi:MAG: hypothetical protein PF569_08230 [Candidatus Woesearchaeota archaeon]|jgi:hypothetical protein|nr:hypothetical protein [Candidatus Woesearchaeota archaeon]